MATATTTGEKDLVRAAQGGDREAFLALYESYATPIYDFCLRMLRNRADAEDVTSDVFLRAMERLGSLRDPDAFKGWLYQIARNAALSHIEARGKVTPVAEHHETATASEETAIPQPEERLEERDLQRLVWDAAATLNPRDYSVFELAVRHGLGSREIAQALDVRPAYAYILTNRLKSSVSEALEALLLARTGRSDCPGLDALLQSYGEEPTPRLRKAVSRHARTCVACKRTKAGRASVPSLLQGTAFAEPSAAFREGLAGRLRDGWTTPASVAGSSAATVAAVALVVVVTAAGVGGAAQRTLDPAEVLPAFPVAEELDEEATPSPEVIAPARPRATPVRTPVPTVAPIPTPRDDEPDDEPTEPPRTEAPPTRPPPTEPPRIS